MAEIKWLDGNRIQVDPPKRYKKCTGTRFATILGLSPWATPFEMWCAITKTYEKPFEETKYTAAGKVIEPKQADYMERSYCMDIVRPKDVYGDDYFQSTYGDFFRERSKIFGGMWDYLAKNASGDIDTVLEMKTTKRVEDWQDDVPEYYALQAALYAYLLGVNKVVMVASFLSDSDYNNPAGYKPCINNTVTVEFKVSERYPDFEDKIGTVVRWWKDYVETGISPAYDEKRDAEILKELRTKSLAPATDLEVVVKEAEQLKAELDTVSAELAAKEKRLKDLTNVIKQYAMEQFKDGDTAIEVAGRNYKWVLTRGTQTKVDEDALKNDGLFDKYTKTQNTYRMTVKGE